MHTFRRRDASRSGRGWQSGSVGEDRTQSLSASGLVWSGALGCLGTPSDTKLLLHNERASGMAPKTLSRGALFLNWGSWGCGPEGKLFFLGLLGLFLEVPQAVPICFKMKKTFPLPYRYPFQSDFSIKHAAWFKTSTSLQCPLYHHSDSVLHILSGCQHQIISGMITERHIPCRLIMKAIEEGSLGGGGVV